ncbi:hypothetical protein [Methylobacterium oryzihabitans]|uniref:Co-chaperone DjlA N-terminal domain-containing protein n=1 Tax=Methylobacterium oryzihabitans TaxID=2499852 RepID=A0A3S2XMM0_9HYPH|nr:hypothetical protein [Methylobacterium oryzihabitans]RVU18455.1 hypothetical protein EOE48_11240 [Methylobacterium oryzihabitans]
MNWNSVKRGLVVGTGAGLATVGVVTLAPAGVALGVLGAFGVCTKVGFGISGGMSILGFTFGAISEEDIKPDIKKILDDAAKQDKELRDAIAELTETNKSIRSDLKKWELYKTDAMHLTGVLVGAACADSKINATEANCIRNQVFGVSFLGLPQTTRDEINHLLNEEINLESAFSHFRQIGSASYRRLARPLLDVIMTCDADSASLHQREINFLTAWDVLSGTNSTTTA